MSAETDPVPMSAYPDHLDLDAIEAEIVAAENMCVNGGIGPLIGMSWPRIVLALVAEVRRRRDLCDAAEAMYDAYARVYVDPRFIHMHALFDAVRAFREADRG